MQIAQFDQNHTIKFKIMIFFCNFFLHNLHLLHKEKLKSLN